MIKYSGTPYSPMPNSYEGTSGGVKVGSDVWKERTN